MLSSRNTHWKPRTPHAIEEDYHLHANQGVKSKHDFLLLKLQGFKGQGATLCQNTIYVPQYEDTNLLKKTFLCCIKLVLLNKGVIVQFFWVVRFFCLCSCTFSIVYLIVGFVMWHSVVLCTILLMYSFFSQYISGYRYQEIPLTFISR